MASTGWHPNGLQRPFSGLRLTALSVLVLGLAGCNTLDLDLRNNFGGFDTSNAVRVVTAPRPEPDNRGVISYPGYQVAVARRGDSVQAVADRIGLSATELAEFNGIPDGTVLRDGEILALPNRVAEPTPQTGADGFGPIRSNTSEFTALAGAAIDRAESQSQAALAQDVDVQPLEGEEPIRHRVERGETAFSIARLYGIPLDALADWNGLDQSYTLREGQFLLIPVAEIDTSRPSRPVSAPGERSAAPEPPSASKPLPPAPAPAADTPESPDLERFASANQGGRMVVPVEGRILRDFRPGRNDGLDLAAEAGAPVRAADAGTVAAITRDTDGVPILVLRHTNGLLTVYAGLEDVSVKKGDVVTRGQTVAKVRAGSPSFLHFEVRKGLEAVDPTPFLNP